MVRAYCDRCRKQISKDKFFRSLYDKCKALPNGSYFGQINIAVPNGDESDYETVDLCEKCDNELREILTEFMKK